MEVDHQTLLVPPKSVEEHSPIHQAEAEANADLTRWAQCSMGWEALTYIGRDDRLHLFIGGARTCERVRGPATTLPLARPRREAVVTTQ